ncbi:MAG: iron-sulfur cluster assembly accessory protein, partial [Gammaproteobacteria bacterium]
QDEIFESKGVKIFVDKLSLPMLIGTEMDYVREGLNEEFQFKNPNSQETCGCGESFSVAESTE